VHDVRILFCFEEFAELPGLTQDARSIFFVFWADPVWAEPTQHQPVLHCQYVFGTLLSCHEAQELAEAEKAEAQKLAEEEKAKMHKDRGEMPWQLDAALTARRLMAKNQEPAQGVPSVDNVDRHDGHFLDDDDDPSWPQPPAVPDVDAQLPVAPDPLREFFGDPNAAAGSHDDKEMAAGEAREAAVAQDLMATHGPRSIATWLMSLSLSPFLDIEPYS
jgi:hypothetical protein